MNFLHFAFQAGPDQIAEIQLDRQARVLLLDHANFTAYRNGMAWRGTGGWAIRTPVRLAPPRHGAWHVVVDLNGQAGSVRAEIRLLGAA